MSTKFENISYRIRRFDPERGVKFITYAVWWVRQAGWVRRRWR